MFTVYCVLIGIIAFFIAALVLGMWLRGHRVADDRQAVLAKTQTEVCGTKS